MSIEATVTKKLVISSIDEFYNYINKKEHFLNKSIELKLFRDHLFLSKHGCPCTSEENIAESTNIYKKFNEIEPTIFEEIKKDIGCTEIVFKLDEKILFEL